MFGLELDMRNVGDGRGQMSERAIWDRVAGSYDTIVRFFDTSYPRVRQRLASDLAGKARVLEVAAGTGQFTKELSRVAASVVASDISPMMIDGLEKAIAEAGIGNVEAAVMSAYELDAGDGTFDAVFCANALHIMDAPKRALAEFRRVLRVDGVLIAPTFLHGADPLRRALSRALSVVSPFVAHSRFSLDELLRLISDAGFEVVHAEQLRGIFPLGYVVARQRDVSTPSAIFA
jgi:ubiquinone/menaquinone biosynthesis C-methylase UbiE